MDRLSYYASKNIPFLFVIDYKKENVFAKPLAELQNIYFKVPSFCNYTLPPKRYPKILKKEPISFAKYHKAFTYVQEEIKNGNTYLLNLTFPTKIATDSTLLEIFYATKAKFKLYFQDSFICFSPERFVKIEDNCISTYPMKGTIDANLPNAKQKILSNIKEMAEHTMVVDLLRNDLNMVAKNVRVKRFRYVDKIRAGDKELLQVSSEIEGKLEPHWQKHLGEIFDALLPAGSITGTPKISTCHIIEKAEQYARGFYTGVFGYFDGKSLDSAVMIRFIEKSPGGLVYKSGGGITIDSDVEAEYKELLDKIYLPL
ncbi:aminodeoxychorismate synthase component I [Nitratiruptor tergarcus]|uniref:Para-aminobenzoate synthetase component 1 n=1 Tax=Nitratiruptor tergarcus DSM 16512 TaxID=1069081 RepID=A0A1W1WRU8_9BACT|nr:aminodeoxychorismate synthase component I [Nitratiruptor tergarcus]SMC09048.1 para-aminobenzoate synthetase component 1 [Nitratiruptor tergarcus DSM 16512]